MQEQTSPTPTPAPQSPPVRVFVGGGRSAGPAEVYQGLQAQREELADQLETLEERREELSSRLEDPMVGGADRAGLEQRVAAIDQRITALDGQIAATNADVARAAAIPGAVVEPPPPAEFGPPEEVYVLTGIFIIAVLMPLAVGYARRIWRRSAAAVSAMPKELTAQLTRLEQAIESMAIEVERIGEGQRFMARTMAEGGAARAIGPGAAEPVEVKPREATPERR